MSYEYMSGMGAMQKQRVGMRRPRVMQRRPGGMRQPMGMRKPGGMQQRQPLSDQRREQLKTQACGGQPCPAEKGQKIFFRAGDRTKHVQMVQRLRQRGCTPQCTYQGFSFYCCPPQPGQAVPPGQAPEDMPLLDAGDIDPFMDEMMDTDAMDPFMDEMYTDDMYADPSMDDMFMDDMFMQNGAMAPAMPGDAAAPTEAITPAEDEKKMPWLLIGGGVVGLAVIGYLLTRK